eukprot:CAMPEP_0206292978 /NCGR_PEP_ID=MMETSP0106_2-20121207/3905_1 /ASSEMBLY_ACC=CAM_ASM_000206 /TAXON_ID=81532 /ORGANISM="Acanthoeca-like sp., Strain 10tr" /LENGTH=659 /DNA_ID=CAMNT_0053723569 /DNA_START=185 /DNA_END=2161 /DNA_ORIENTATION=-
MAAAADTDIERTMSFGEPQKSGAIFRQAAMTHDPTGARAWHTDIKTLRLWTSCAWATMFGAAIFLSLAGPTSRWTTPAAIRRGPRPISRVPPTFRTIAAPVPVTVKGLSSGLSQERSHAPTGPTQVKADKLSYIKSHKATSTKSTSSRSPSPQHRSEKRRTLSPVVGQAVPSRTAPSQGGHVQGARDVHGGKHSGQGPSQLPALPSIGKYTAHDVLVTIFEQGRALDHNRGAFTMDPVIVQVDPGNRFSFYTTDPRHCFWPGCPEGGPHAVGGSKAVRECFAATLDRGGAGAKEEAHSQSVELHLLGWMTVRLVQAMAFIRKAVALASSSVNLSGLVLLITLNDGIAMCTSCPEVTRADHPIRTTGFAAPVLTFDKLTIDNRSIAIPDPDFTESDAYNSTKRAIAELDKKVPWAERRAIVFWRSSGTGTGPHREKERYRVCKLSADERAAGRHWLDARLVRNGDPSIRLSEDERKRGLGIPDKHVGLSEQLRYRYLLDVDGNGNAWSGCFWKLATRESVVFKVEGGRMQWYYHRLQPFVHYLPVRSDLSDLRARFDWAEKHPREAQAIARAGAELVRAMTLESEMQHFAITLIQLKRAYRGGILSESPHWSKVIPVTFNSLPSPPTANSTTPRLDCHNINVHGTNPNYCWLRCPPAQSL